MRVCCFCVCCALQSKIRDMRSRLAGFDALLQRQAAMFNELRPLGRYVLIIAIACMLYVRAMQR